MNTLKPLSSNPATLKRQPSGSFKPVSAIGAQRQTLAVDKVASINRIIDAYPKTTGAVLLGSLGATIGANYGYDHADKAHKLRDALIGAAAVGSVGAGSGAITAQHLHNTVQTLKRLKASKDWRGLHDWQLQR